MEDLKERVSLDEALEAPDKVAHWEDFVIEAVLRVVRADETGADIQPHEGSKTWQKSQPAASRARSSSRT